MGPFTSAALGLPPPPCTGGQWYGDNSEREWGGGTRHPFSLSPSMESDLMITDQQDQRIKVSSQVCVPASFCPLVFAFYQQLLRLVYKELLVKARLCLFGLFCLSVWKKAKQKNAGRKKTIINLCPGAWRRDIRWRQ